MSVLSFLQNKEASPSPHTHLTSIWLKMCSDSVARWLVGSTELTSLPGREAAAQSPFWECTEPAAGLAFDALGSSLSLPQTLPGVPCLFEKPLGCFLMFLVGV